MRPDERDYEVARLLYLRPPRYRAEELAPDVRCEPCAGGQHRLCVRPCVCTDGHRRTLQDEVRANMHSQPHP